MISAEAAAEKTRQLVALMPIEWRGDDIKAGDLAELRERKDCKALLKEITRAVPLRLLLEHGTGSLVASTKEQLMAPYFFLSTPVEKIGSFVSHRWAADPLETAHALMGHAKLSFLYKMIVCISILMIIFFYLLPPLMIITAPMWCNFVAYAILTTRSPTVLRMLGSAGYDRPFYWFDKSTVHQKQNCLTQAGLSLFDYYLGLTDQFTILFNPECARIRNHYLCPHTSDRLLLRAPADLTRVWTVYELAWWLKHKPDGKITFVPLTTNASIYRLVLKFWPIMVSFALFGTGVMVFGCFYFSNVAQNDQFAECAVRDVESASSPYRPSDSLAPFAQQSADRLHGRRLRPVRLLLRRHVPVPDRRSCEKGEVPGRGAAEEIRRAEDGGLQSGGQGLG